MSSAATNAGCRVCGGAGRPLCTTHCSHDPSIALDHQRCCECGLVFVANRFTNDQLGAAYGALDDDQYYAEVGATEALKFQTAIGNLEQLGATRNSRVLDIGTGNGDFLATLQDAGFTELAGHEIPGADTSQLERRGIPVYKDYDFACLPAAAFDVVTMLDVMEHVPDPQAVAKAVFRALKPGGVWYFHTPFVTPVDRMMHALQKLPVVSRFGRAWQRSRTSIYHLQNYTPEAISRVLTPYGFETAQIQVQNELSWPIRRYLEIYVCGPLRLPRFAALLLVPFAAPVIATNVMNPNKGIVAARKPQQLAGALRRAA